jgi:ABC-type nitrate/sulfonate/bicarbonate transport system substrate-binding protein
VTGRRTPTVAGAIALTLLLCACQRPPAGTSGAAARAPIAIRFADLINVDMRNVPLLMAFDELAARGYAVEKTHLTSGALISDLLARGEAEFGAANDQTVWTAILKGADIRTIAQYTAATTVLAARGDITSCRQLDRKRLGVAATSGLSSLMFGMYFSKECGGARPERLVMPESAARAAALLAGRLDAATLPGDDFMKLQMQSSVPMRTLMTYAETFRDMQVDGLHVRHSWAVSHPDAVKDLLRAMLHAHRLIRAEPARLFAEGVRRLNIDAATARTIGEAHLKIGIWNPDGGLTREDVQKTIDFLVQAEMLPAGTTAEQVADLSYLDAVLAEVGRTSETRAAVPAVARLEEPGSSR